MTTQQISFGEHKDFAIQLLKDTIQLLDENNIDYYLISGTLLGLVRHNDFIPWDDDIDLIVSNNILNILPDLVNNYKDKFTFLKINNDFLKICSKNGIHNISHVHNDKLINKDDKYSWPFIDLFLYTKTDTHLKFFYKDWDINQFEPYKLCPFLNIENVKIPNNPDYFLKINYGNDYLTNFKKYTYSHKLESNILRSNIKNNYNYNYNSLVLKKINKPRKFKPLPLALLHIRK